MENKDYVTYEYATKSVKAKDQTRAIDLYEAFGWEVTGTTSSLTDGVTLSLKRDRKLKHKQELNRLERKAEEISGVIRNLEASKKRGGDIFAYAFGCFAALVLGGGMRLTMLIEGSIPALVGGIVLGILGIVLCAVNYPIYKRIVDRKTRQILPVIDDNEEKLANLLEQGNDLLMNENV